MVTRTNIYPCALFALLTIFAGTHVRSADIAPPLDILETIRTGKPVYAKPHPVSPEWVGTVKTVAARDPRNVFTKEAPNHLRVTHAWTDRNNHLAIGRVSPEGGYVGSDVAVYYASLPTSQEVVNARNLATLHQWFGPPPPGAFIDGVINGNQGNWAENWICFTATKDGRLRWLAVFAMVSGPMGPGKEAVVGVDEIKVSEGILRVADPTSVEEKKQFKTADMLFAEREDERAKERDKLPEPLRSLVAANQKRGDSDLAAFKEALNEIRRHPDPRLFDQLAERMDERTTVMRGYMADILTSEASFLKINAWEPAQQTQALRYAVAALPRVKNSLTQQDLAILILASLGGGRIQIANPLIDVEVRVTSDSHGFTQHHYNVEDTDVTTAAAKLQQWFQDHYPQLKTP